MTGREKPEATGEKGAKWGTVRRIIVRMLNGNNNSALLSVALAKIFTPLVKEAIQEAIGQNGRETTLLTPSPFRQTDLSP